MIRLRRLLKWLAVLFVTAWILKVAIDPLVSRLTPGKAGQNALLGVVHWLGSPASDLWVGAIFTLALCLVAARDQEMTLGDKLVLCLPILGGLVAACSYRLLSGAVPTTRQQSLHDPASWLLVIGLAAALIGILARATWHQVQLRCSANDSIWAYEQRYSKPYVFAGGPTVRSCFGAHDAHQRSESICTHDLALARRRNLWVRFWGTDINKLQEPTHEISSNSSGISE